MEIISNNYYRTLDVMGHGDYQHPKKKKIGRRAPWLHPADPSLYLRDPYTRVTSACAQ
jgi:hypothetical protein